MHQYCLTHDLQDTVQIKLKSIVPTCSRLYSLFRDPKEQPPILELMWNDITKISRGFASKYEDKSCPQLGYEDIIGECNKKIAELVTKDKLTCYKHREEAFKVIRSVLGNHIKGIVSRNKFTIKRGYVKSSDDDYHAKNVNISIDDEESAIQIEEHYKDAKYYDVEEYLKNYKSYFNLVELAVLRDFGNPSEETMFYVILDAYTHKITGKSKCLNIKKISPDNRAKGLGLSLEEYNKIVERIKSKIMWLKNNEVSSDEIEWNAAIQRLEEKLGVNIPSSAPKLMVRRLLTLAARDRYIDIINDKKILADLNIVGAKIPEVKAGRLACFGVLFHKNNRSCCACDIRSNCETESKNYGLDDITLSPQLLAEKELRTPVVYVKSSCVINNSEDENFYTFMCENFHAVEKDGCIFFGHKEVSKEKYGFLFKLENKEDGFKLEFIEPCEEAKRSLINKNNTWFADSSINYDAIIGLVNNHASEKLMEVI